MRIILACTLVYILHIHYITSRKCVDPFSYLDCCPNIYNETRIAELKSLCENYHKKHELPYKTSKKCTKLYCAYACIVQKEQLVSFKVKCMK